MRNESAKQLGNGGWLHRLNGDVLSHLDSANPNQHKPRTFSTATEAIESLEARHGKRKAVWTYHNANGEPIGLVIRWDGPGGKIIRPVSKRADSWISGGMPTPRHLYRLPELSDAETVFITEGEKTADALAELGFVSTTSAHGSKSAKGTNWKPLAGRRCIIFPDNDSSGRTYADEVSTILAKLSPRPTVRIANLPGLPERGDAVDFVKARRDAGAIDDEIRGEIESLAEAAEVVKPEAKPTNPIPPWLAFPTQLLPEPLRSFVSSVAVATQCDESFVALPLLAGLASAVGNARTIRLRRTWCEPCILWTAIIGESGTMKSPAIELALKPIRKRQRNAMRIQAEDMKKYRLDLAAWEGDKSQRNQSTKPEKPTAERCVTGDVTPEALVVLLDQNPRGLLVARDELAGWLAFDRYSKRGGECSFWLEVHGGRSVSVDRKTSDSLHVPRAAANLTGGIQPATLRRALGEEHLEDGLAARLLLSMPPRQTKRWTESDVPERVEAAVEAVFDKLRELEPALDGEGEPYPLALSLTPKGKEAWVRFYNAHAKKQARQTGALAAALSKLEGYAARLALVVHCVRKAAGDPALASMDAVDDQSIEAGAALVRWFGHEAERLYSFLSETAEEADARRLEGWIRAKHQGTVTLREMCRGLRQFRKLDDAKAALDALAEARRGAWHTCSQTGRGHPKELFVLSGVVVTGDTNGSNAPVRPNSVAVTTVGSPESPQDAPAQAPSARPPMLVEAAVLNTQATPQLSESITPDDLAGPWRALYEERAAIREYDGGQAREHAEAEALREIVSAIQAEGERP